MGREVGDDDDESQIWSSLSEKVAGLHKIVLLVAIFFWDISVIVVVVVVSGTAVLPGSCKQCKSDFTM